MSKIDEIRSAMVAAMKAGDKERKARFRSGTGSVP